MTSQQKIVPQTHRQGDPEPNSPAKSKVESRKWEVGTPSTSSGQALRQAQGRLFDLAAWHDHPLTSPRQSAGDCYSNPLSPTSAFNRDKRISRTLSPISVVRSAAHLLQPRVRRAGSHQVLERRVSAPYQLPRLEKNSKCDLHTQEPESSPCLRLQWGACLF
jgi:hypothetical protein